MRAAKSMHLLGRIDSPKNFQTLKGPNSSLLLIALKVRVIVDRLGAVVNQILEYGRGLFL